MRRIIGYVLAAFGAWLAWAGIEGLRFSLATGSDLSSALMEPPTTLLRLAGGGLIACGGLIAGLNLKIGGAVALIGALLFALLAGAMAGSGAAPEMWTDEAISAATALVGAIALLLLKRR